MKTNLLLLFIATFTLFSCNTSEKPAEEEIVVEQLEFDNNIQILDPVAWNYTTEKVADNEYKITFNAQIDEHWYVYSSQIEGLGPIPTSINYDDSAAITDFSEITENGEITKTGFDDLFEMDITKFGKTALFSQNIKTSGAATITGFLEFMTCDSTQCLFPDPIEFSFDVN